MMHENPKLSQHSFLKAIDLDSTSATPWSNLALLYVYQNEPELAEKAIITAETVDPDHPNSWALHALSFDPFDTAPEVLSSLLHASELASVSQV